MFGNDMTGVAAIAEALKANVTLLSVKCALPLSPLSDQLAHKASAPLDVSSRFPKPPDVFRPWFSLGVNRLGSKGAEFLAGALKLNRTITDLKCAAN